MSQIAADTPPGASVIEGPATAGPLPSLRVWLLALAAGLIAGFASWLIGESVHGKFAPPETRTGVRLSPQQLQTRRGAIDASQGLESEVAFGALGALSGLALGLAGGAARRSARAGSIAAIAGLILGGAAGAILPGVLVPIYFKMNDPDRDDLILAILTQGGTWCAIGAAAGAALGIGLGGEGRALRALLGGLSGAIAGVLVYELVGTYAFPLDGISNPLSATSGTRLFARLAATIFISAGAALGALGPLKKTIQPRAFSSGSESLTPETQPRS